MLLFAAVVLASIWFMFVTSKNELAPTEDQGILFFMATAPRTATLDYHIAYASQAHELGRLSFYDADADTVQTITGFELNSSIEDE